MAEKNDTRREPAEIRRELAATRERMGRTMDTIEYRFDPERLKYEASNAVREQTVGRVERFADNAGDTVKGAGADVFDTIKKNPLPAALAAIGLGWLFMEGRNQNQRSMGSYRDTGRYGRYSRSGQYDPYAYRVEGRGYYGEQERGMTDRFQQSAGQVQDRAQGMAGQAQDKAQQVVGQAQDTAQQVAGQAQDKAQQVVGQVQDTAHQVADQAQYTAQQVGQQAQQFAGQAQDQVSEWADAAQEQVGNVKSRFEELLDENPLLVGAAAVALGAAIGLGLPNSRKEDEIFGQTRDKVMDKAQDKAQDTMQKVQQVAQKAGDAAKDAAKDEAQKQNLATS